MTYKTDDEIKNEVQFQIGWDSRIRQSEVGVIVKKGVVTLTGMVDSYAKKLAAQQAAHRARGVLDVANDIEVKILGDKARTDADIAQAARHALDWNVLVPANQIHTTVMNGWVTLEGEVEYYRERLDAERAISQLPGVRGVINKIKIASSIEPERIKFLIEDVLELRADRRADRIRVQVDGGAVTLSGAVNSWDEKKSIVGAVSHTPGVTAVNDQLFVDPYDMHSESASAS
jgi:osmotically-inducible protein OsmY